MANMRGQLSAAATKFADHVRTQYIIPHEILTLMRIIKLCYDI